MSEMSKTMRLDKFLTTVGIGTRSEVKNMIRKGQVDVNDERIKKADIKIDTEQDRIRVLGELITYQEHVYYMFHKPAGCVTATRDNHARTVMDYINIPGKTETWKKRLFPVGRLDIDTEGLLLITDDGKLAHELLSPKSHVKKVYYASVAGEVNALDIAKFKAGLDIGDEKETLSADLEIIEAAATSECLITIVEGRFHQIKRMFEAVDKKVLYLKRLSMGTLKLDDTLAKGCFRELTETEIKELRG